MDGGDGCTTMQMYLMPLNLQFKVVNLVFSGEPVVKNLPANEADTGSISGPGRLQVLQGN